MISNLPDIPLLQKWLDFTDANGNSQNSFADFVDQQLSGAIGKTNVGVPGSTSTALYSGEVNGRFAFKIANDLADRSKNSSAPDGDIRIIDNTKIGKFLNFVIYDVDEGARRCVVSVYVLLTNSQGWNKNRDNAVMVKNHGNDQQKNIHRGLGSGDGNEFGSRSCAGN